MPWSSEVCFLPATWLKSPWFYIKTCPVSPFPLSWLTASVSLAFLWGPVRVTHSSKHPRVRSSLVSGLGKLSCHWTQVGSDESALVPRHRWKIAWPSVLWASNLTSSYSVLCSLDLVSLGLTLWSWPWLALCPSCWACECVIIPTQLNSGW